MPSPVEVWPDLETIENDPSKYAPENEEDRRHVTPA